MIAAVQIFNSPSFLFKIQLFPVISQIAWTYLLHEFYIRKSINIIDDGRSLLLGQMIARHDCPLSEDVKKNLIATKELRDQVEHTTLNSLGRNFWPIFQANCLNFDQALRKLFGEQVGLNDELSVAIQFSKMDLHGLSKLQKYDISPEIEAIDAAVSAAANENGNEGAAYKFKVNFTFEKAVKGDSNIVFNENNPDGLNRQTFLTTKVVSDDLWPYKPNDVVARVKAAGNTTFNSHHHQLAWKKFGARPASGSKKPKATKKDYCQYHTAHGDYTYSDKWVELLISIASNDEEFEKLKRHKPKT
tara:strand:- start:115175 stop:116083 length:909 start_codon:yes stop_codon:yes gene_type:complete